MKRYCITYSINSVTEFIEFMIVDALNITDAVEYITAKENSKRYNSSIYITVVNVYSEEIDANQ